MVGDKEVGGGDLPTIADDLVVTKYKMAAEIVNSELMTCTMLLFKIFVFLLVHDPTISTLFVCSLLIIIFSIQRFSRRSVMGANQEPQSGTCKFHLDQILVKHTLNLTWLLFFPAPEFW